MKKIKFLKHLNKSEKLKIVEVSESMKDSYLEKAKNCLKASKILLKNELYENSVSESYYCIYNSLLALLFKIGIKCENHSASIIIFEKLFADNELVKILLWAKEERIDKQYYVETQQVIKVTKKSCEEMIEKAEDILLKLRVIIDGLNNEKVNQIRNSFEKLLN
ncbi:MAG: HEPN protein [archaeon GW2011_AR13]|nr:MAG: HEPN protein [archaeon GW2011_AR13]HIG94350.1 HEPN domain-containing protein [Nanoarchaeota archaeon]HIH63680.1 HEPN domain-containing protein [Nanoarchaeota archaeon]HIJ10065.1 HEPN domain-containing protein [Nanoarchaeota archaeon]